MEKQGYEQQQGPPQGQPPMYQHDPNMPPPQQMHDPNMQQQHMMQDPNMIHQQGQMPPMQQGYSDPNMIHQQGMMQPQHTGSFYQHQQMQSPPPQNMSPYGSPPPQGQYMPPQGASPQPAINQQPGAPITNNGSQFKTVTPIGALGRSSAPVDCPACGQRAMTQTSFETGNTTHAWAAGLCCFFCLGCIPYLMSSLKDVNHKCGKCGVLLATWHRSGSTDVHIHA